MKHIMLITIILLLPLVMLGASYKFAMEMYEDGLYEEAIEEFERVIESYPTSQEAQDALFQIGESYRQQEQWQQAEDAYTRLIRAYPVTKTPDRNQYYQALMQYRQGKYRQAGNIFALLIKDYPNSEHSKNCLRYYLDSFYQQSRYKETIELGKELTGNYAESRYLPDLLLLTAKASFALGQTEAGYGYLDKIRSEYPESDARWEMIELEMELLQKQKGADAVIVELGVILQGTVPRQYEKQLRQKLVDTYIETGKYHLALPELELMLEKYNNAPDLDLMVIQYLTAGVKLKLSSEKLIDRQRFDKVFRESDNKDEYELLLGWAYLHNNRKKESQAIVDELLKGDIADDLRAGAYLLAAEIADKQSHYRAAIEHREKALKLNPADAEDIILKIGEGYKHHFKDYSTAINYFQQIIYGNYSAEYNVRANMAISNCYREMGDAEAALRILSGISKTEAADAGLAETLAITTEYVKKYELKDYKQAFDDLLTTLESYTRHNNQSLMQQNLAEIMAYDLKEFSAAAELLPENTPETGYQKALILLAQVDRYYKTHAVTDNFSQVKTPADDILLQVNTIIYNLREMLPEDRKEELRIKKLSRTADVTSADEMQMKENYLQLYPGGEARNEFLLDLAQEYASRKDTLKSVVVWQQLEKDKRIAAEEYYEIKLMLADHYYQKQNYAAALAIYDEARDYFYYHNPELMYHFVRSRMEVMGNSSGLDDLKFLVNNMQDFSSYDEAVLYLIDNLRQRDESSLAVEYAAYVPEHLRDNEFYLQMADDYLRNGMLEDAKISLMRIEDKDTATLLKLADLQYRTGDHTMALYSYGVLEDGGAKNAVIYERSGQILFNQGDYKAAADKYNKYLTKAEGTESGYVEAVQNYVISYYKQKNRPRAEELAKKYKKVLTPGAKQRIALAEAVYYTDMDANKSEKQFNKLLKEELEPEVMIKTYFWRGILYLKNKNVAKAKADFITVSQSTDPDLANQARFKLGLINFSENNFEESLENYYLVIENDENGELALEAAQNFAKVCKTIEEWEKAIAAYEIILEKWGDQSLQGQTIFDIAFCYYRDKDYEQAIEMFNQSLDLLSDRSVQAEAQYWIGMSYFGADDYDKAVTELFKVSYTYEEYTQWAASAELQAGEAYQKLNNLEKARRIYNRVIDKYGSGSQWGSLARERLGQL